MGSSGDSGGNGGWCWGGGGGGGDCSCCHGHCCGCLPTQSLASPAHIIISQGKNSRLLNFRISSIVMKTTFELHCDVNTLRELHSM